MKSMKDSIVEDLIEKVNEIANIIEDAELYDDDFHVAHELSDHLMDELKALQK